MPAFLRKMRRPGPNFPYMLQNLHSPQRFPKRKMAQERPLPKPRRSFCGRPQRRSNRLQRNCWLCRHHL